MGNLCCRQAKSMKTPYAAVASPKRMRHHTGFHTATTNPTATVVAKPLTTGHGNAYILDTSTPDLPAVYAETRHTTTTVPIAVRNVNRDRDENQRCSVVAAGVSPPQNSPLSAPALPTTATTSTAWMKPSSTTIGSPNSDFHTLPNSSAVAPSSCSSSSPPA